MMYYHDPFFMFGTFGLFYVLFKFLIFFLIIWFIFALLRGRGSQHLHSMWHSNNALSILNERFAKGEISKEEYEERKKTLLA